MQFVRDQVGHEKHSRALIIAARINYNIIHAKLTAVPAVIIPLW